MAKNLNDIAWESLLKDIPVVSEVDVHGFFDIDSKTIKNYREHTKNINKLYRHSQYAK